MSELRRPDFEGTLGTIPHVNVIFFVEGSFRAPDFDTIRTGRYSKKDMCIEADVSIINSELEQKSPRDLVVKSLSMANAAAFHFFEDKGLQFPLAKAEEFVRAVNDELNAFD